MIPEADMRALKERIESLVTVESGNTEISACYYTVMLLGHTLWDRGGPYPETKEAAEKFARDLRQKLVAHLT
jgi:hypothetical protein